MFKRLFQSSSIEDMPQQSVAPDGARRQTAAPAEPAEQAEPVREAHRPTPTAPQSDPLSGSFRSFDEIYRAAAVRMPAGGYSILKLGEMVNSPHLAALSMEAKRASLLMALDAAGVHIEDILQDALIRQRVLNDYEESEQHKLEAFQAAKMKENSVIQAELDRVTAEYMEKIQANLNQVARREDNFRAWVRRKQVESQQMAEAAAFCAPQGSSASTNNLSAVLARCGAEAVMGKKC